MTPSQRQRRSPEPASGHPARWHTVPPVPDGARNPPLDLVTMVVACDGPPPTAGSDEAALLRLCARPRAVVEISAHLQLPCTAVTVLLSELLAAGLVRVREPVVPSALTDPSLIDAVVHRLKDL